MDSAQPIFQVFSIGFAALFGSTIAAISGFGGAAVLLPVLVHFFGVREAIPILTVAQLIGNGSRVWFNRREVHWKVVAFFAVGAMPMALLGGYLFSQAPVHVLIRFLGLFLLATVVWRIYQPRAVIKFSIQGFTIVGALFSFLSALVGSVGPFIVPFFLAFGLVKGAFIGTEAFATVIMHVFKIVAYQQTSVMQPNTATIGLAIGPIMIFGSWLGKSILNQIPEYLFLWIIEALLVAAGLSFLING